MIEVNRRTLLNLYPRAWRERYGEEFLELLDDRVRPRDVVDLLFGAASEWMDVMTGSNRWNDQAQRATRALAQSAGSIIVFQTLVVPIVSLFLGVRQWGALADGVIFGFVSSLLQCGVTLGPVALVAAPMPWRSVPYSRAVATLGCGIIAARISGHIAWGPVALALVLGAAWIGYKTVRIEPEAVTATN